MRRRCCATGALLGTLGPVPAVVASATLCGFCAVLCGTWMDRQARPERVREP